MTLDPILMALIAVVGEAPTRRWPCCELVCRVVRNRFGLEHPNGGVWWRLANAWDVTLPWAPVEVYYPEVAGNVADVGPQLAPGVWYVMQGWRALTAAGHVPVGRPGVNGHTWLWYAVTPTQGYAVESSTDRGPRVDGRSVMGDPAALVPGITVTLEELADRVLPFRAGVKAASLYPLANA
jgi:hypothetical protein